MPGLLFSLTMLSPLFLYMPPPSPLIPTMELFGKNHSPAAFGLLQQAVTSVSHNKAVFDPSPISVMRTSMTSTPFNVNLSPGVAKKIHRAILLLAVWQ